MRQAWLLVWFALLLSWWPAAAAPSLTVDGTASIELWPALTLRRDGTHQLTLQQVLAEPRHFVAPTGTPGNLGLESDTVWLRARLAVPGSQTLPRVLDINYPTLNQIDVYLVRGGEVVAHHEMGNRLKPAQRTIGSRSMAAPLLLAPGEQDLLVRVTTQSSMVLPITLHTPEAFLTQESREQLMLGVVFGLALCMLGYSVSHWILLRDRIFLQYGGMLAGILLFLLAYFGVGQQVLWPDWPEFAMRVGPMAILLSVACGAGFHRAVLEVDDISLPLGRAMQWVGFAALAAILAGVSGLPYPQLQLAATSLGLTGTVLALPACVIRARRGDPVAPYMMFGWASYVVGAGTLSALLTGLLAPSFWAQHMFPLTTLLEMSAWMCVLGLKVKNIHRNADRARVESDALRKLAHTDALTGLPNRRGMQERLAVALKACSPQQLLSVYLLDLDGFKRVNDRHGHDVGDALLVAVGAHLQAQLRGSDTVARLRGDEFVVLACGLADEAAARDLGDKLLGAFDSPFAVAGEQCTVGVTIGFALAPGDSDSAAGLLKRADTAMYLGKQGGRRRLTRASRHAAAAMA